MAIYAKACTEITSACSPMTLHTIEYSLCWKTLTLVTTIKIKKRYKQWTHIQSQQKHNAFYSPN